MGDACCSGTIEMRALKARQRRVLAWVLAINLATFAMMVVAALASGASSLLSGTLDNLGDALTYLLSLLVINASATAKARVALFKGLLILGAAIAVGVQIAWRLQNPGMPAVGPFGLAAVANLAMNGVCLWLLMPFRQGDVNMASAWECSRNDVFEGLAVIAAAVGVWLAGAGWPDLVVAVGLLLLLLGSALRVLARAIRELRGGSALT
jgi:Co/Zn/Cd efflux system component